MARYSVNLGVTYRIEADNEQEAEDKAYELAGEQYGKEFVRSCWEQTEEIEASSV